MNMRFASITLTAGLLCACSQVPVYERPQAPIGAEFESGTGLPDTVAPQWWRSFGSPQLDALIEQATASNFDLRAAVARIGYDTMVSPYWTHELYMWFQARVPEGLIGFGVYKMHVGIRFHKKNKALMEEKLAKIK